MIFASLSAQVRNEAADDGLAGIHRRVGRQETDGRPLPNSGDSNDEAFSDFHGAGGDAGVAGFGATPKAPSAARKKAPMKVVGPAGPLGAMVGGAIGAATGTVGAILGVDDRPRFREYVVRERGRPITIVTQVRVGIVLPEVGRDVLRGSGRVSAPQGYRYTMVNDRPVLVEPRSRRIVE